MNDNVTRRFPAERRIAQFLLTRLTLRGSLRDHRSRLVPALDTALDSRISGGRSFLPQPGAR